MKFHPIKNVLRTFLMSVAFCSLQSCADDTIEPELTDNLVMIAEGYAAAAKVEVYAEQELHAGYNQVFLALYDSVSEKNITDANVSFYPLMQMSETSHSCPVENPDPHAIDKFFQGGILFTMPSGEMGKWTLEVNVHNHQNGVSGKALFDIEVLSTTLPSVISFMGLNGVKYILACKFPEKIRVGVNPFELIAFRKEANEFYPADNLVLKLNPEMPSMDHGSPNNEDPVHTANGHYAGKVNFTMTGQWRLNLDISAGMEVGTKYFDVSVE